MGLKSGRHAFKFGSDSIVMNVAYDDDDMAVFVTDANLMTLKAFAACGGAHVSSAHVVIDGADLNLVNDAVYNGASMPEDAARTAKIIPFRRAS